MDGMIHRIHHATSSWIQFHEGLEEAKTIWEKNQNPPSFYNPIVRKVLDKLNANVTTSSVGQKSKAEKSFLLLKYQGDLSEKLVKRVRNTNVQVIYITTKLKTVLPSLKEKIPESLRSRVIYQLTCSGCKACYVGMTTRHLQTRTREHLKSSAPVGQHLGACYSAENYELKVLDQCYNVVKLATLESLYIDKLTPCINTREKYATCPLTVRI